MSPMTFHSLLFPDSEDAVEKAPREAPGFFVDMNLDQIIDAITAGRQEYDLKPFFYSSLKDVAAIEHRHEIFRDLEQSTLFESLKAFGHTMRTMRDQLVQAEKLHYKYQKERWFLDAVETYCAAVNSLARDLSSVQVTSRGLQAFRRYLTHYVNSARFTALQAETKGLFADLATVKYCLRIKDLSIKVSKYESEIDYTASVEETFAKFKQGAVKDYRVEFSDSPEMNHVEAGVLDLVAKLYPEVFSSLDSYYMRNAGYLDQTIARFDREIQFYIAYLEHLAVFRRAGLKFCYPEMCVDHNELYDYEGFDLALAYKLLGGRASVVCNDFCLKEPERIFVVSGPNQGGKTTFARTFGQLHYLASIGCPVPGRHARLFLFDGLFTHFEKEEDINNLRGKLHDDLVRIHDILSQATGNSILILNEIFTSTTLQDALFLSREIMGRICRLGTLCVWVTFIDELASFGEQTVSMVSTVAADDPTVRAFKIMRRPADGLSYAIAIAEKYRLTYARLKERMGS